jgi:hypothetical protein
MEEIKEILSQCKELFIIKDFEGCHQLLNKGLAHCATFNERIISVSFT